MSLNNSRVKTNGVISFPALSGSQGGLTLIVRQTGTGIELEGDVTEAGEVRLFLDGPVYRIRIESFAPARSALTVWTPPSDGDRPA